MVGSGLRLRMIADQGMWLARLVRRATRSLVRVGHVVDGDESERTVVLGTSTDSKRTALLQATLRSVRYVSKINVMETTHQ